MIWINHLWKTQIFTFLPGTSLEIALLGGLKGKVAQPRPIKQPATGKDSEVASSKDSWA